MGYFEAGSDGLSSQAVHQSHLSAARRAELCSNFTLPPGLSPVGENERQDEAGATCEKTDCVCGEGGALKRDGLTKICWRACLVGLWEFHYHLKDTERKTCQVRRGISLPFV